MKPLQLKHLASALLILLALICSCSRNNSSELDSLYNQVDAEIAQCDSYTAAKEARIAELKKDFNRDIDDGARFLIYDKLIEEYESFVSDSAMKYVEEAYTLAEQAGNRREQLRLLIKKADIASHAGLFAEAHEMLRSINRQELDTTLLTNLYWAYTALYQYESEYIPNEQHTGNSNAMRDVYTDSLMRVSAPSDFPYITNWTTPQIKAGNFDTVRQTLESNLREYKPGDRRYSIIASTMARMYEQMGNRDEQKKYLSMTVISDIRGAVKENMAIRELATAVFEDGDIDRANHYMKVSFEDANFFSARMRSAQSNRMLPVIDEAYDNYQKKQQSRQQKLIYLTTGLLLVAIAAIIFNMFQVRKVKSANKVAAESNSELSAMSEKLRAMNSKLERTNSELELTNSKLERTNRELRNSSRTTEEYAGLFMEYTSFTINNLQKYHLALRNLALKGNVQGILKKLDSSDISSEMIKQFYQRFDEAILNILPQFVDKVNSLLREDGKIVIRPGEKLNTELRILALLRIGFVNPEKIAEFLRCSTTTIYSYRSRIKRRAIDPDNFEKNLMEI